LQYAKKSVAWALRVQCLSLEGEAMPERRNDNKGPEVHIAAANLEVRLDPRYELAIEIEVSGIDRNGQVFHKRSLTMNVSEWGCAFLLSVELRAHDIISLRIGSSAPEKLEVARQWLFQVVRVTQDQDGWIVGAWKMDRDDVWGVDFDKIATDEECGPETSEALIAKRWERRRKNGNQ
jgi:hypothetical protein